MAWTKAVKRGTMSSMEDTRAHTHQFAQLLAWYREMGVTAALDCTPTNWRVRGSSAPGAGFVAPEPFPRSVQPGIQAASPARRVPPTVLPGVVPAAGVASARPPVLRAEPTAPRALPRTSEPPVRVFDAPAKGTRAAQPAGRAIGAASLTELAAELYAIKANLNGTAKNLCLYRGAERARVMVIGDVPGADEDKAGKPFVGSGGHLLDRMLSAIGLSEADVHISHVLCWRTAGNQVPIPEKFTEHAPYLQRQIELVGPEIILLLGGHATKHVLGRTEPIMKLCGKWFDFSTAGSARPIRCLATLPPSYLLKTPASKRQVWQDLLELRTALD